MSVTPSAAEITLLLTLSPFLPSPFLTSTPLVPFPSMAFYLEEVMECTRSLLLAVSGWIPRHVIGAVLVSLPAISVLSHLFSSIPLDPQVNTFVGIKTFFFLNHAFN